MISAPIFALLLALPSSGAAQFTQVSSKSSLLAALASAKPGARIHLEAGNYDRIQIADLHGAEGQPIVIAAADSSNPPVVRGMQLSDVSYVELIGFVIADAPGNGLNIDDGGTFETPSHHVTLRVVTVKNCGGKGNEDGIKLSGVDDFRLEHCTVETWGRGGSAIDMVGCHRGVLQGCTIRDRAEDTAASGVQMKGGTRDVVIQRCRFENAGDRAVHIGGSTALEYFRPRPETFEAKDITVEGCTFFGSEAPIAFVGVDGATVRFNTFFHPRKWFLRILQETREKDFVPSRNGVFSDNLVVWSTSEIAEPPVNVGEGTAPETFRFARNWWWCVDAPERSIPKLPVAEEAAAGGQDPRMLNVDAGDLRLATDSPARAYGAGAWRAATAAPR